MPTLTILPSKTTVDASEGDTVLFALLVAGIDIPHKCSGKAECDNCHIFVHDGRKSLSKMGRAENDRLDQIVGVGSKSRLACQAVVGSEDVTIEILGFGSGL